ncbi:hypothetical protein ACSLUB_11440 [Bordetella hinzii]|uniref:hypothetical protein n=1 Tax=Bordetella hinzii TaxID=103855 RepID=UPI0012D31E8C|nr:hypothetical protein [Bordetella hinzii]
MNAPVTNWLPLHPESFEAGLSTTGSLLLTWKVAVPLPDGSHQVIPQRMGIEVPAQQAEVLLRCLQQSATIQETLAAMPPPQGAH